MRMSAVSRALVVCSVALFCVGGVSGQENAAKDRSQWANSDPARKKWFESQQMNEGARRRLDVPYKSCCDNGDVFRTRFRVGVNNEDQWEYLDGGTWRIIPSDIIKDEPSIDQEPILFRNRTDGRELCFFKPNGGI